MSVPLYACVCVSLSICLSLSPSLTYTHIFLSICLLLFLSFFLTPTYTEIFQISLKSLLYLSPRDLSDVYYMAKIALCKCFLKEENSFCSLKCTSLERFFAECKWAFISTIFLSFPFSLSIILRLSVAHSHFLSLSLSSALAIRFIFTPF